MEIREGQFRELQQHKLWRTHQQPWRHCSSWTCHYFLSFLIFILLCPLLQQRPQVVALILRFAINFFTFHLSFSFFSIHFYYEFSLLYLWTFNFTLHCSDLHLFTLPIPFFLLSDSYPFQDSRPTSVFRCKTTQMPTLLLVSILFASFAVSLSDKFLFADSEQVKTLRFGSSVLFPVRGNVYPLGYVFCVMMFSFWFCCTVWIDRLLESAGILRCYSILVIRLRFLSLILTLGVISLGFNVMLNVLVALWYVGSFS